jgi:KUP system potassium uptake protein
VSAAVPSAPARTEAEPISRAELAAKSGAAALALGALGVVFGDIGTSPLYSVQAVFNNDHHAVHTTTGEVYGVLSLIFWSITMIVSVGYVSFIMRADDKGEGGVLALTGLLQGVKKRTTLTVGLITLGVLGAALFFGDSMITPAISVLSAVEGLKVAVPSLSSLVLPIAIAVLTGLFFIQRFGTGVVGKLFGPVMLVWFTVIALIGLPEIIHHPDILRALSPSYGAEFFFQHGAVAFIALAGVVLAVTGAEALYADMGHFGRSPIRRAWFFLVFPALTINYLAQGALILRDPKSISNPFFLLVPGWAQVPAVFLATFATVIASQAVISGAFSVTQQAVQIGFLPRLTIRHTDAGHVGRIYTPAINALLFVAVLVITIGFGSSTSLASAYGVAVTGTFILSTILFLAVARLLWNRPKKWVAIGGSVFLTIEVAFFSANLTKVVHGGWLPLAVATVLFLVMTTWHRGREIVTGNRRRMEGSLHDFVEGLCAEEFRIQRIPGIGVFMNPNLKTTPFALKANVERNQVLQDSVVVVTVETQRVPHVPESRRASTRMKIMYSGATGDPLALGSNIAFLSLRFGFLDEPDVPAALRYAAERGLIEGDLADVADATYFLSTITIEPTEDPGMARWRQKIFVALARNSANPAAYFRLPDDRTISIGARVQL